jgi:SAM-dependent methyltransferase
MNNEPVMSVDPTFQLWKNLNDAVAHTRPLAPGVRPASADTDASSPAMVLPHQLRYLIEEAELTRLWDVPLDRAVRRVLAQSVLDQHALSASEFPQASALDRVLIVRSGGMHVLRRLLDRIFTVRPDAAVCLLCHEKDVVAVQSTWPAADIRPLVYPRLEAFEPAILRTLLAQRVPGDVRTAFYLDNNPMGTGTGLEHVEAAIATRTFDGLYLFNAGERVYEPRVLRSSGRELTTLVQDLLRWWNTRSAPSVPQAAARYTSDDVWEAVARQEPHWGVCSLPQFKKDQLTAQELEGFFHDGERMIENYISKIGTVQPDFRPHHAVDFGCGVGRLTRALAKRVDQVDAIDISPTMRRLCAETCADAGLSNVTVLASDATLSELTGRPPADLIVASIVLQHVHPDQGLPLVQRLIRHLAPGGWAVLYILFGAATPRTARPVFADLQDLPTKIEMNEYDLNAVFHEVEQQCDLAFQTFARQGDRRGVDLYCRRKSDARS